MDTSFISLRVRTLALVSLAVLLMALNDDHAKREGSGNGVPFDRILHANREPQNWLTYSGGYSSQRYSELAQITPGNIGGLTQKWVVRSHSREKQEATPLVVDGVMYTVQGINDVIALDAATGRTIWTYIHRPDPAAQNCCAQTTRGLAILDHKLFLATLDAHMIALDADTGKELWNTPVANPKEKYTFTHAPLVIKDKVIEGTAGGEYGIRGFIAAFSAKTGREVWRFHTVPGPGEPGRETWAGDSWKHGGAPVWLTGSWDPQTNLTFWGVGNPSPNWDGDGRIGDNLYSCSVIALDVDTGKLKWYFQFTPHDEFDWDAVQIPVLADIPWKGSTRKAMLWANRNGMFYVLDRTTGEFLLGKAFVKQNWSTGFDKKGRPILAPGTAPLREGTRIYPDDLGATNWYSPSYSPRTGLFYVPARENSSAVFAKGKEPPEYRPGEHFEGTTPAGRPKDVYSMIRAIDPVTGDKKWDYRLTAATIRAGVLTTASDILFGGSHEGMFYALDARTGKLLWQTNVGAPVAAAPITFSVAGKQYVSIQAGPSLFTFWLNGAGS